MGVNEEVYNKLKFSLSFKYGGKNELTIAAISFSFEGQRGQIIC